MKIAFRYILLFIALSIYAESNEFSAEIDTNNILIGERINLSLKFNTSEFPEELQFPLASEVFPTEIEILDSSLIDTLRSEDNLILRKDYVITSFDTGTYEIPEITLIYRKKGFDDLTALKSEVHSLRFNTVSVDTTQPIKDIKPPFEEHMTFAEIWHYILIGLGLLALAIFLYFYLKHKKTEDKPIVKYDPQIPPHIFAVEELKKLENEKLWQKDEIKRYYSKLSEIIKIYLERRFEFNAIELTTYEVLFILEKRLNQTEYEKLKYILNTADMAKFAKVKPLPDENSLAMKHSYEFIESTKLVANALKENNELEDNKNE